MSQQAHGTFSLKRHKKNCHVPIHPGKPYVCPEYSVFYCLKKQSVSCTIITNKRYQLSRTLRLQIFYYTGRTEHYGQAVGTPALATTDSFHTLSNSSFIILPINTVLSELFSASLSKPLLNRNTHLVTITEQIEQYPIINHKENVLNMKVLKQNNTAHESGN
jgi:hypothetical protein